MTSRVQVDNNKKTMFHYINRQLHDEKEQLPCYHDYSTGTPPMTDRTM
jgi:hypothetical protein